MPNTAARRRTALILPLAVFSAAFVLLRHWIVDDAGITFAYGRNLAAGYGLVSQAGQPPVEGYSNFLWLTIFLPFFKLGVFNAVWTPKIVSLALVAGTFWGLQSLLRDRLRLSAAATAVAITLVAANPAFSIWTVSGLENPLLAFLICAEWWLLSRWCDADATGVLLPLALGLTASAIALTRPEGVLYCLAVPAILVIVGRASRAALRAAFVAFCAAGTVFAAFLLFRWTTFHDFVPNTYWAKGGVAPRSVAELVALAPGVGHAWIALHGAIAGGLGVWAALFLIAAPALAARAGRLGRVQQATGLLYFCTALNFVVLPPDWMSEYRFATPFVLVGLPWLVWCADDVLRTTLGTSRRGQQAGAAIAIVLVVSSLAIDAKRLRAFETQPTLSLDRVVALSALPYNQAAARLGLEHASLLAPDLGGLLMQSHLTVIDLVGLCDPTIARTIGRDEARFHAYVLDERRPTFIHTHDYWTWLANFDADPRFRRDYDAIREYVDVDVERRFGRTMMSGDFVRKSALAESGVTIRDLRTALEAPGN